ncbi:hypothetical protein K438DRAFT_1768267 [Mycena galopus ATCC 62051]|nr:hypothetical protein K438DRAFT_1768267 [Mycena galopus ATCC 62051]
MDLRAFQNSFVKPTSERGQVVGYNTQYPVVLSDPALLLLPPALAGQFLLWRYVRVGSSAVGLASSGVFSVQNHLRCLHAAYPAERCRAFHLALGVLYPVAIPSTSLLFFVRVRAIYGCTRAVTIVFGLMWTAVLGMSILVPIADRGANIGPTRYCIIGEVADYAGAIGLAPGLFDTAVFLAISYKLVQNNHVEHPSWKQKARAFFTGAHLPSFSRSLFADGQIYYLITSVSNIVTFILPCLFGLGTPYRGLLVVTNMTLTNVMACRNGYVKLVDEVERRIQVKGGGERQRAAHKRYRRQFYRVPA